MPDIAAHYLTDVIATLRKQHAMADRAIAQVRDDELFATVGEESNSIAVIMKHIVGNMRSRWTDFLTTDGEKPDRNRDAEFETDEGDSREALSKRWAEGWSLLYTTLEALKPEDLNRRVAIRSEEMSVLEAIDRQLVHYANHVGQIVLLAKYHRGAEWKSLSIPKKKRDATAASPHGPR